MKHRIIQAAHKQWKAWLVFSGFVLAAWPTTAAADCNLLGDPSSCTDAVEYNLWLGIASFLWAVNRMLLLLAYQIDQVRNWIVTGAFDTAWNSITGLVNPLFIPVASTALLLAILLFMLVPMTGKLNIVNIRHVLMWSLLAPLLIVISGPLLADLDNARTTVGTQLAEQAGITAPGAIFGARASDMAVPQDLYPSNPCGNGTLDRPSGSVGIHLDDLAAAMMYANAQDIHCPDAAGPFGDIPDGFSAAPPKYAYEGDVGTLEVPVERRNYIEGIRSGTVRLALGILPSTLAVSAEIVNLLFSLSLVILFISIPLNLIFVFFQQTSSGITTVFRRSIGILQTSWACSFILGLLSACLSAAATYGSATGYVAFSAGSFIIVSYLALTAFRTISESVLALSTSVQSVTGLSITEPISMAAGAAAGAASLGAAAATGGTSLALTGMAAMQQTGNRAYAASAVAGRAGLGTVGEVAQIMGMISPESEVATGLHAGDVARRAGPRMNSFRAMRIQMGRDANIEGDDGLTIGERDRLTSAASADPVQFVRNVAGQAVRRVVPEQVRSPIAQTLESMSDAAFGGIDGRWEAVTGRSINSASSVDTMARQVGFTDRRGFVMSIGRDGRGKDKMVYEPRLDDEELPSQANALPTNKINIPRLWKEGYRTQMNVAEGTTSFWRPMTNTATQTFEQQSPAEQELARAKERQELVNKGILKTAPTQAVADVAKAQDAVTVERSRTEQPASSPTAATNQQASSANQQPSSMAQTAQPDLSDIQAKLDRILNGQGAPSARGSVVIDGEYTISEPIIPPYRERPELQSPNTIALPAPAPQAPESNQSSQATKPELDDIEYQVAQSREAERHEENDIEREIVQSRNTGTTSVATNAGATGPDIVQSGTSAPQPRTNRGVNQREALIASLDAEITALSGQLTNSEEQSTTEQNAISNRIERLGQVRNRAVASKTMVQQRTTSAGTQPEPRSEA